MRRTEEQILDIIDTTSEVASTGMILLAGVVIGMYFVEKYVKITWWLMSR